MSWTVRVEHDDGTTDSYQLVAAEIERDFGKTDLARVDIFRDATPDPETTLVTDRDKIYLEDATGTDQWAGLLGNVDSGELIAELVVDGPAELAKQAEPTRASLVREEVADSTIVADAIGRVPDLGTQSVATLESSLRASFQHASPHEQIGELKSVTGANTRYTATFDLIYAASLGSDKTGTTLSPSNQNLAYDSVRRQGGVDEPVTHLRALGAGRGALQAEVNLVPDADATEYPGKITYSSSWSSGDTEVWDVRVNRSIDGGQALRDWARDQRSRVSDPDILVDGTVYGLTPALGDEYTVSIPERDVSTTLEVRSLTERIDAAGRRVDVELSSTAGQPSPTTDEETREKTSRFARRDKSTRVPRELDRFQYMLARRG